MLSVTWAFGHPLGRKPSPPVIPRGRRGGRNLLLLFFSSKADSPSVAAASSSESQGKQMSCALHASLTVLLVWAWSRERKTPEERTEKEKES